MTLFYVQQRFSQLIGKFTSKMIFYACADANAEKSSSRVVLPETRFFHWLIT